MAGKSDSLENSILDHILGKTTYTAPATLYVALFTAAPTDAGGGTEVSGGAYARAAAVNNPANFPAAVSGSKSNGTAINFAAATALWGTVTAVGIFDAATEGNLLYSALLTAAVTVPNGGTFSFAIGQLVFVED